MNILDNIAKVASVVAITFCLTTLIIIITDIYLL